MIINCPLCTDPISIHKHLTYRYCNCNETLVSCKDTYVEIIYHILFDEVNYTVISSFDRRDRNNSVKIFENRRHPKHNQNTSSVIFSSKTVPINASKDTFFNLIRKAKKAQILA